MLKTVAELKERCARVLEIAEDDMQKANRFDRQFDSGRVYTAKYLLSQVEELLASQESKAPEIPAPSGGGLLHRFTMRVEFEGQEGILGSSLTKFYTRPEDARTGFGLFAEDPFTLSVELWEEILLNQAER